MRPFVIGWYEVVRIHLVPRNSINCHQRVDSNCHPWSVDTVDGTPKHAIQPFNNVQAAVLAVIPAIGNASDLRVNRLTQVSAEGGRGPRMSRWMWSKRVSSVANVEMRWLCVIVLLITGTLCMTLPTFWHWYKYSAKWIYWWPNSTSLRFLCEKWMKWIKQNMMVTSWDVVLWWRRCSEL